MPANPFPLSAKRAIAEHNPDLDPLVVLYPHEQKAAELFALACVDPAMVAEQFAAGRGQRKWGMMLTPTFNRLFETTFGCPMTPKIRKHLENNPLWRKYVAQLRAAGSEVVKRKLERDALGAYEDYQWSRTTAKEAGDYKEVRQGAQDHLDRVGLGAKKDLGGTQNVVVVLRGRNFDAESLDRQLPAVEAEVIEVEE